MSFTDRVISAVRRIPRGQVATYGQIAALAGSPRGAIAVGQILHRTLTELPWQRVINSQGYISTSCLEHPATMQGGLLEEEGVKVNWSTKPPKVDLKEYLWSNF